MLPEEFVLKCNRDIIDEIAFDKNLSLNTILSYQSILKEYCIFHGMLLDELLNEAENDEENGIILKKRRIKSRILNYRKYLIEKNNQPLTINTKIAKIKSLYSFYDIEVPHIPLMIKKNYKTINDIPSKEDIVHVLENTTNLRFKAIILFLLSSGNSLNETLNITISDFMNATCEYHNEDNIVDCINSLKSKKDIIPTFNMVRKKTNYPYISFCSYEACDSIINYLNDRIIKEKVYKEDKLFNVKHITVQSHFRRANDKLGFGFRGQYRYFHAHALRKFFATELLRADMDSIIINFLSGRSINRTQEAYFKADPSKLKLKYLNVVNSLTIDKKYRIKKTQKFNPQYLLNNEKYFT